MYASRDPTLVFFGNDYAKAKTWNQKTFYSVQTLLLYERLSHLQLVSHQLFSLVPPEYVPALFVWNGQKVKIFFKELLSLWLTRPGQLKIDF